MQIFFLLDYVASPEAVKVSFRLLFLEKILFQGFKRGQYMRSPML